MALNYGIGKKNIAKNPSVWPKKQLKALFNSYNQVYISDTSNLLELCTKSKCMIHTCFE